MRFTSILGRRLVVTLILAIAGCPALLPAQAESWGVTLGVGRPGIPFFGEHAHDGLQGATGERLGPFASVFFEWSGSAAPLSIRSELFYNRLTTGPSSARFIDGDLVPYALLDEALGLDLIAMWPQRTSGKGGLFLTGGPSLLVNRLGTNPDPYVDDVTDTRWSLGPGLQFGGGVAFRLLGISTGIELKYHQGLFDGRGTGWGSLTVPVRFLR